MLSITNMQRQTSPDSTEGRRRDLKVGASFVHSTTTGQLQREAKWKEHLKSFMQSYYLANAMAGIVILDAFCTCADIDARAAEHTPSWVVKSITDVCLGVYTLEAVTQLCLFGRKILRDWMTVMDISIVACGWAEAAIDVLGAGDSIFRLGIVRALRLVRIFRLIRLLRRIRAFRELHKLVMMMSTCMRTLAWSFLLCALVMTVWAMLMVEIVNPTVKDMQEKMAYFDSCESCQYATSSVMNANLLLFKTVVAGDSWGQIAVPVIQENPGTLVIFIGSLVTLVFGVLNVIVAVVVDTFADARQRDVQNLAEELDDDIVADKKDLQKIFNRIDVDGSGQLTMDELLEGARSDPAFQSRLRVMDIDENDLMQLFSMIDNDSSGTIEVAEFIGPLSRWAHDSKTAPRFIKYNLLQSINLQEDLYDMSQTHFHGLSHKIDDIQNQLHMLRLQMTQKVFEKEGSPGRKAEDMDGTRSIETTAMHTVSMELESSDSGIILPKTLAASEASKEPAFLSLEREFSRGDLEMPHASREVPLLEPSHMGQRMLEGKLEESMARIEGKLERLWQGLLLPSPGALGVRLVGPEDSFDSSRLNRRPSGASVGASPSPEMEAGHARRKVKPAWDMFQSMYMDKGVTRRRASLRKNDPKEKKKDEKKEAEKGQHAQVSSPKETSPVAPVEYWPTTPSFW